MQKKVSTLKLNWTVRKTKKEEPLHYLDFTIAGKSFKKQLGIEKEDYVSPLGYGPKTYQKEVYQELTLIKPSITKSKNVMIYVCPTCGDIGCGAVTAQISQEKELIVWSNFAYENNYEPPNYDWYKETPTFYFNKKEYFDLFEEK